MDQLNSGGTDVISYTSSGATSSTDTSQLNAGGESVVDNTSLSATNANENNNENINPVSSGQPMKMDINNLLSQIMSITSQSLKDAQERLVYTRHLLQQFYGIRAVNSS